MASINTAGANSGKDFNYGSGHLIQENFIDLFNETINKLELINQIKDETTFKVELNKIRKKMNRLITKYFNSSLNELSEYQIIKKSQNSTNQK